MIRLTRRDGSGFWLNPHLIETCEGVPDTVVTLVTGRKHVVKETCEELVRAAVAYRRRLGPLVAQEDTGTSTACTGDEVNHGG